MSQDLTQKTLEDLVSSLNHALALNTALKWRIEEVESAGDALAQAVGDLPMTSFTAAMPVVEALRGWKEARRG